MSQDAECIELLNYAERNGILPPFFYKTLLKNAILAYNTNIKNAILRIMTNIKFAILVWMEAYHV